MPFIGGSNVLIEPFKIFVPLCVLALWPLVAFWLSLIARFFKAA